VLRGRAPGRRRCIDIADRLAAIASTARSARGARRRVAEVAQDRRAQAAAGLGIRNHRRSMDDSLDVGPIDPHAFGITASTSRPRARH
jgi:hypothetical protein